MTPGPLQILIVLALVVLLFGGRGKISSLMGDMGKGISSFKKGIKEGAEDKVDAADAAINVTPPVKATVKKDAVKK